MVAKSVTAVVEGVPVSPTHQVKNSELAQLLREMQTQGALNGALYFADDKANLDATSPADLDTGFVLDDTTPALNGVYQYQTDTWVKTSELPAGFTDLVGALAAIDALAEIASTGSADDLTEGADTKVMTAAERTKLSGVEAGATANDTDANLKSRANHTGTQAIATVDGLQTALDGKADDAATTAALAAKADDAATTAALATKADDAATTAALATKADGRIIDDDGFIVADEDGNVTLKLGADGILRVLAAAFGTVGVSANASVPWSVGDAAGDLLAMLTDEGMMRSSGFEGAGFRLTSSDVEGFAFCVKDEDGNIPFGIALNGDVLVPQSESQEVAPSNVVDFTFVEGWGDASESLAVSWVNDTTTADVVGLRLSGVPAPSYARSIRSRAFPHVAGKYIHTALFQGLSAGATYEISFPGATMLDHVRVPPRAGVKVAMMSDYQQYDFSASGLMGLFGTVVGVQSVDFMVLNGDYVNDNGEQSTTMGNRWFGFLEGVAEHYRTPEGAMIPFIATTGNHEGVNLEGTSNAQYGGDGTIGMITDVLSWGYDPEQKERNRNSAARLTIGKELLILTLETDHTEPLPDQLPWLQQQLTDHAADFRHVAVFGHSPAFFGGDNYELDDFANQARALRNDFWPAMAQYSDKIRFYGVGHDHFLGVTARLKMDPDDGLTDAENDVRWTTAADGIRQLGCGPWGGGRNNLNDDDMAEVSSLDASPKFIAAMGYNAAFDEVVTHGTGLTNTTAETWHIWVAEFDSAAFTATAIGSAGQQFYTLTENL